MPRHPFDPVSAALGILAAIAGLFVALGDTVDVDTDGGRWIAVAAVLVGLMIIPWRRTPRRAGMTSGAGPEALTPMTSPAPGGQSGDGPSRPAPEGDPP